MTTTPEAWPRPDIHEMLDPSATSPRQARPTIPGQRLGLKASRLDQPDDPTPGPTMAGPAASRDGTTATSLDFPAGPVFPGQGRVSAPITSWSPTMAQRPAQQPILGLPLPNRASRTRMTAAYYTVTALDARGRVADGSPLRVLQWTPGLRLKLFVALGAVVAAAHADGQDFVTRQGHLRLPADLRHSLRLAPGDRLLAAAHTHHGLLVVYTMPALDAMVAAHYASLVAEAPA